MASVCVHTCPSKCADSTHVDIRPHLCKTFYNSTCFLYRLFLSGCFFYEAQTLPTIWPVVNFEPLNHNCLFTSQIWRAGKISCLAKVPPPLPRHPDHYRRQCTAITLIKLSMCVGERVLSVREWGGRGLSVCVCFCMSHVGIWETCCVCRVFPASKSVH